MTVYSGTVVHTTPKYQLAMVELADGTRIMGRIQGEFAGIGERVVEVEMVDGVRYFQKA
jgi:uncharacterized OB-fold protein